MYKKKEKIENIQNIIKKKKHRKGKSTFDIKYQDYY